MIDESPDRFAPVHLVSDRIVGNVNEFCESIIQKITSNVDNIWIENKVMKKWRESENPLTSYQLAKTKSLPDSSLTKRINTSNSGIIIAGKMDNNSDSKAVLKLSEKLGWPVFADITSGLRTGSESELIVEYFFFFVNDL